MKQRRVQLIIGGLIVAGLLAAIAYQGVDQTISFYTPAEVLAKPDAVRSKTIRIMAMVEPKSTQWDPQAIRLSFKITEDSRTFIPVQFRGVKPDMYREGQGVVVEGKLGPDGTFQATNLLVKHSEEYKVDPAMQKKIADKEAAYKAMLNKK
jgi:cytochrome c-type biogenesis protein CcmE